MIFFSIWFFLSPVFEPIMRKRHQRNQNSVSDFLFLQQFSKSSKKLSFAVVRSFSGCSCHRLGSGNVVQSRVWIPAAEILLRLSRYPWLENFVANFDQTWLIFSPIARKIQLASDSINILRCKFSQSSFLLEIFFYLRNCSFFSQSWIWVLWIERESGRWPNGFFKATTATEASACHK